MTKEINPDEMMTTALAVKLVSGMGAGIIWNSMAFMPCICRQCERPFWKATSEKSRRVGSKGRNGVYCSEDCRLIGYGHMSKARQAKYQLRVKMGLVKGPAPVAAYPGKNFAQMTTAERRVARTLRNNRKVYARDNGRADIQRTHQMARGEHSEGQAARKR